MQGGCSSQGGSGPRQKVDPGGQRCDAGQDAAVDPDALVQRKQRRNCDKEDDRAGAIKMYQQRKQSGARHNARRPIADAEEQPVEDRFKNLRVGQEAKEQNRKDEHADDRGDGTDSFEDEGSDLQAKPCGQRTQNRDDEERDQRRDPLAHGGSQQAKDRDKTPEGQRHTVQYPQPSESMGRVLSSLISFAVNAEGEQDVAGHASPETVAGA